MSTLTLALGAAAALTLAAYLGIPALLRSLGFQPRRRRPRLDARGRRALVITTSCDRLGPGGGPTGVAAFEMTGPYYVFVDAGMTVDLASVAGGQIPIDPKTTRWPIAHAADHRFLRDTLARQKAQASVPVSEVDFAGYDIVFIAGGWGAAFDLASSAALGEGVSKAWRVGALVGAVCHGGLGLLRACDETGAPLVRGRRLTAVTDKQLRELGIIETPAHPERDLRAAGAVFESRSAISDLFANCVVRDGRLITGQNQNSSEDTAWALVSALNEDRAPPEAPSAKPFAEDSGASGAANGWNVRSAPVRFAAPAAPISDEARPDPHLLLQSQSSVLASTWILSPRWTDLRQARKA